MHECSALTGTPVNSCIGATVNLLAWSAITTDRAATAVGQSPMSSGDDKLKRLLLVCAIGVAELAVASTLGSRPVLAQSGCGSSWAICRYRAYWRVHGYHSEHYQRVQQRISRNCNPATVWKDAC